MYFLGIDIGGTYSKVALYNKQGQELKVVRKIAKLSSPRANWVERDMEELWQDVCRLIQDVAKNINIQAISITAHGKGLYALGKDGQIIRPAILSADSRALHIVKGWYKENKQQKAYKDTLQNLWTGHPVSILRWLKENEPDNYNQIEHILMAHDYIRYRLTGDLSVEITNISESNLYNAYKKDFDDHLYHLFGIADMQDKMPKIIQSHECAGHLTKEAALDTGLGQETKVYGGLFDVVAATLCASLTSPEQLNAVFGTWSVSSIIDQKIKTSPNYNYVWGEHCIKNSSLLHDASPTSASNFEWFVQQFLSHHQDPYEFANEQVKKSNILNNNILFSPFLYGSNKSLGMPAGFHGLSAYHNIGDIICAIWEGICFAQKQHINRLLKLYPDIKVLRVTGGPVKSSVWMQMFADIMGIKLEVPNIDELGCFGATLCAYVGEGIVDSYEMAMEKYITKFQCYEPDIIKYKHYENKYESYKNWLNKLEEETK